MARRCAWTVLALICFVVAATRAEECKSVLTTDCGAVTGDACLECAESHRKDLAQAGCTLQEISLLCGSASPCAKEFQKDCPAKERSDKQSCLKCADAHASDLQKANCTQKQVEGFCGGGPGPGPSPSPSPPGPSPAGDMKRVLLDNSGATAVGGRCLDSSPAGYYYSEASAETGKTKWVVFLEGGGACYTKEDCGKRSQTDLGSSKKWPATTDKGPTSFISSDPSVNPDFYDGHRVYVPYCTGDVHAGQRTSASADTWSLWFDGHLNFKRIIADLQAKYGMANATHVLLSGSSAGGVGTFTNADFLASLFPSATVKAAPQAGWFFPDDPHSVPAAAGVPLNFSAKEVTHSNAIQYDSSTSLLWQAYANPACLAAYTNETAWYCGTVHNAYQYIKTPLFVIENMYDTNQMFVQLGAPHKPKDAQEQAELKDYISYYGAIMRDSIGPQIQAHGQTKAKGKDGLFLPSCLDHGISLKTTLPRPSASSAATAAGIGFMELVGDWYFERNKLATHVLIDGCNMTDGQPCNPSCDNKPLFVS